MSTAISSDSLLSRDFVDSSSFSDTGSDLLEHASTQVLDVTANAASDSTGPSQ